MKTDVEIAREIELKPIQEIGESIGLSYEDLIPYGHKMAKITKEALDRAEEKERGKLVLVTAINPTPAGEGKTTTNIGLSMGLERLGHSAIATLREPSLGPVFGIKGGAAGGGYAQVLPMEDINLHFTGDFHAITSANNLISAAVDNHLHQGNDLSIDPKSITFKRVLDMNDRALREVVVGMGSKVNGVMRSDGFDITVASEIMAILCLSEDAADLKERVARIQVGLNTQKEPVYVRDLGVEGAVAMLLKDAILPNLVQTTENTPAIIHGGPFANIAHGCNSIIATRAALHLSDYAVTEAGFGADLGAEKFLDIATRAGGFAPDCIVVVATVRALKYNGYQKKEDLGEENIQALKDGFKNLERHVENMRKYGVPVCVAINRFPTDTEAELSTLRALCDSLGVPIALSEVWAKGGEGALELAEMVVELCEEPGNFAPIYPLEDSIEEKIQCLAQEIYHAKDVEWSPQAAKQLETIVKDHGHEFPVCVAKTQMSFSDDPTLLGAPEDHTLHVRELYLSNGAGFVVVKTGEIMTMPGLPKVPAANHMDIDSEGAITGLF
ncbi:MAG: formate--tetrahydrofolate ligase [Tissierellia bacterium]|nr:formate--tetrahydrofolate ligase [Tissierellia bacterium]